MGAGADTAVSDRWGNTPLDEAKRVGALAVAAFLEELAQLKRQPPRRPSQTLP